MIYIDGLTITLRRSSHYPAIRIGALVYADSIAITSDTKLRFCEKERGKVWKEYMEQIMNEENDWDHNVEGDAVEGPVVCVSREEVLQALNELKTGKVPGPLKYHQVDCCWQSSRNSSDG